MDPLIIVLLLTVVVLTGLLVRSQRRRRAGARRLAHAVGHPSADSRTATAVRVAQEVAQLGLVVTRKRWMVTAPGLDGIYVLHVLPDTVAIGYDTNSGRIFVGIARSPAEAALMVARHAKIPSPA